MWAQLDGTTVVMADMRRIPGRHKYFAMVPQWDFLNLIASAAAEEPSFTLRLRTGRPRDRGPFRGRGRGAR
ncbi:hypothetical protein ACFVTP_17580 [Streptomyces celluloflavus]|uniref:hypothetical protein n=1 Tax=Streptomyces celluloflavus TaxID=58344 RepID=UPI0036DB12AB